MIDLHCHVLPGLDDGAADLGEAVEMARLAAADGVRTMVATPHINQSWDVRPADIGPAVSELNEALSAAGVAVEIVAGAEISITRLEGLEREGLEQLCMGDTNWILLESPFTPAFPLLERAVFELQSMGFGLLIAHPERSPTFLGHPERLATLVERGALSSVTAGSLTGQFGERVRSFTARLVREGLVHNVASDAHDTDGRSPVLSAGREFLERDLGAGEALSALLVEGVPAALLRGERPPPVPVPARPRSGWRRLLGR